MFNGDILRDAIISGANNIQNNRQSVDELNVFPVPDGDTGTNMSMTIGNAARTISALSGEPVGKIASAVASALLKSARGNSGVILSLIFSGFAKSFKDKDAANAEDLAAAMELGVAAAYKAVMKPTEGTILTVARLAAEKARAEVDAGETDEVKLFEAILSAAEDALASTPELLPVLKKAGVVDAGGQGLIVIFEGMLSVLRDGIIVQPSETASAPAVTVQRNAAGEIEEDITFTYCTEFLVNRPKECPDPKTLRAYLETIGDCVVVVDDEEIIKVHIHTDHPGKAIEKALTFGPLVNLKIENMRDQHERAKHDAREKSPKKAPARESAPGEIVSVEIEKTFGFVSVSAGDGLETLFKELGADFVVSGGQTMNPCTDDILAAIEQTPAETVFVLPNNKNIIMAAEQAMPLSSRKVIVLPTRTIPQGISAMLAFDPELPTDENVIAMQKAFEAVGTGQVTFAARDSDYDGRQIKKGELLALQNGKVSFTESGVV